MSNAMTKLFGKPIYTYTRKQAIEDGEQVDACVGDFAEVTRQHFSIPCFISRGLFVAMERAVRNPRYAQDFRGIWHDVCFLARQAINGNRGSNAAQFSVIIKGAGRSKSLHTVRVECGALDIDNARPCLTFGFPEDF